MGHRQMFNTSQLFEIEQDWSHGHPAAGQSYVHMGMFFVTCYSVKMPFASIPSKPCTNDVQLQFRLALKWETDEWFEYIND